MIKVLGLIILLYGVAGVIGSYLAYRALQGPMGKLKNGLGSLAERLARAGGSVKSAAFVLSDKIKPALSGIAGQVGTIAHGVGEAAGFFGHERDQLQEIGDQLRAFTIPVLTPTAVTHRPLDLDVSMTLLSGVSLTEYEILGVKVYGPPMKTTTQSYTLLDLGTVNVITALDIHNRAPLEPLGAVFDVAAAQVDGVREQLDDTRVEIEGTQHFLDDQAQATGDAAQQLDELGVDLQKAHDQLGNLSRSRWLELAPLALIGYFALIHLAFALTGLALLLV
jgi:hypothetical protein